MHLRLIGPYLVQNVEGWLVIVEQKQDYSLVNFRTTAYAANMESEGERGKETNLATRPGSPQVGH